MSFSRLKLLVYIYFLQKFYIISWFNIQKQDMLKFYPVVSAHLKCDKLLSDIENLQASGLVTHEIDLADVILVIWGDWWMLKSIKKFFKFKKPFLGINCGTLGFLLNNISSFDSLRSLTWRDFDVVEENLLKVSSDQKQDCVAVNDVIIWGSILDFGEFKIKGEKEQIEFLGTGTVISTPIGSTAYWLNLGWPVMPLKANIWWIAGIASKPFELKIIDPQKLNISWSSKYNFMVGVDWRQCRFDKIKSLDIAPSEERFKLLFLKDQNFEVKRLKYASKKLHKC